MIGLIPAGLLLHGLSGGVPGVTAAPRLPVAARHGWPPWTLAVLDGLTGAAAAFMITPMPHPAMGNTGQKKPCGSVITQITTSKVLTRT